MAVPGVVEVWPMVEAEPKAEMEAWDAPFDALPESSPRAKLAEKIARTVRGWIAGWVLCLIGLLWPILLLRDQLTHSFFLAGCAFASGVIALIVVKPVERVRSVRLQADIA